MIINRYCQISTKYLLYSFQKLLKESKIFILILAVPIFILEIKSQTNDSLSLKLKKIEIIIIPKGSNVDEWNFEEPNNGVTNDLKDKKLNLCFSAGWFSLQNQQIFKNNNTFNLIPNNKLNSNIQNICYYFKHFELFKKNIHFSIGGGFKVQRLNLGNDKTTLLADSVIFDKNQEIHNKRNVLKYRYWFMPISFSISNRNNTVAQIEFNNHFLHNGKLDIINDENIRQITKSRFFQKKYYCSVKANLIFKNFGLFAESSLMTSSTIFDNQYNFSCGIIFCNFR